MSRKSEEFSIEIVSTTGQSVYMYVCCIIVSMLQTDFDTSEVGVNGTSLYSNIL